MEQTQAKFTRKSENVGKKFALEPNSDSSTTFLHYIAAVVDLVIDGLPPKETLAPQNALNNRLGLDKHFTSFSFPHKKQ